MATLSCNLKSKKASDPLYICNQKTGKWVLKSGKIGKELLASLPQTNTNHKKIPIKVKPNVKKNGNIIDQLTKMLEIYKNQGEKFKVKAYSQAISALDQYPVEIESGKEAQKLTGVGKSIAEKIDIILKTGTLPQLEQTKEKNHSIKELTSIWGIGPVKAEQLYNNGIHSLSDLNKNQNLLTQQQKVGLQYHKEFEKKIPRQQIDILNELVKIILPKEIKIEIAGSYRRGAKESGDIDMLISPEKTNYKLSDIVLILQNHGIITNVLSMGDHKALTVIQLPGKKDHYRMDLEYILPSQWGTGLLYFTGSKTFNVEMRQKAKEMGFKLNHAGIIMNDTGKVYEFDTEKKLFDFMKMTYIEPKDR